MGPPLSSITVLCYPKRILKHLVYKLSGVCSYWFILLDSASCIFLQIFADIERSHSGFSQCAAAQNILSSTNNV